MSVRAWLHPIWGQTELCRWADLLLRDVSCLRRDAKLFTVQCSPAPRRYMPFLGLFWEDFLHCDGHLFYEFETRLYYNLSMPAGVLPAVVAHDVFGGNFSWLCGWKPQVWSNIEIKATVYYSLKSTFVWSFLAYCIFFFFFFFFNTLQNEIRTGYISVWVGRVSGIQWSMGKTEISFKTKTGSQL